MKKKIKKHRGIYLRGRIFWIMYAGIDGKLIQESSHSNKVRDAQALLHKRKTEIMEGKQLVVKRIGNHNFKELVNEYSQWAERQKSYKTKKYLIKELNDYFGNVPLKKINTMALELYQTKRLEKNKPATVNRLLATLKHMFTKAYDWNMVGEDTLKAVRKVKFLPENNRRLRYLSDIEWQSLVNACDEHLKPIVITALNTGMRKGEILNLRWNQVDIRNGFILLDDTKNGQRREIPINDTLRQVFVNLPRRLDIPYVFFNPETNNRYVEVKKSFKSALTRAKIKDFRFHDLRHTFASHLVMNGVGLADIQDYLGHSTTKMTNRYAHLSPSHKKEAIKVLDRKFNPNLTKTLQFQNYTIVDKG